jgi:zinc transport system ATP-binding protein
MISHDDIRNVGGYGVVGRRIAEELARRYAGRVLPRQLTRFRPLRTAIDFIEQAAGRARRGHRTLRRGDGAHEEVVLQESRVITHSRDGMEREHVLEVENLHVSFGSTHLLRELTFSVEQGTSLAIIGPNGSGKTVLFKALVGALPYQGRIRWAARARIGYVPQKLDLERDLPITGLDLLRAKVKVTRSGEDVVAAHRGVGLGDEIAKPIGSLSGGQFQRLLVALALIGHPSVLLLDEPTAGVDEPGQERLNELIRRLQEERGLTVLLISHELSVVYRYATNVLCLSYPRACFGPPKTILTPELLNEIYGAPVGYHIHD